jgi:hypothetical protein
MWRRTRTPAIQAARGFAPTAWKRRPTVEYLRKSARAMAAITLTQKSQVIPSTCSFAHEASAGGTADSFAIPDA